MHLFAGHGGGLLADLILGHTPVVAVEWDGYACQVLRERAADGWFPGLRVWEGDVRLFHPSTPEAWIASMQGRVANGVPNRVGQLKGYGNAQVPIQAATAYRLLGGV